MNIETRERLVVKTLTELIGMDPFRFCHLRRGILTANILKGIIHPDFIPLLEKEKYRKDFRDIYKFARDRVTSTLVEDYFEDFSELVLNEKLQRLGCDKDDIIHNNPITSKPDFICLSDNSFRELCSNFTGVFFNEGIMRFRDNKLPKLIEKSKRQLTFVVGIDTLYKQYQLIKIYEGMEYEELECIPQFGGKPGQRINLDKGLWKPLTRIPNYKSILMERFMKRTYNYNYIYGEAL